MSLRVKQIIIAVLGVAFLVSLIFVQWLEVVRRQTEAGIRPHEIAVPDTSKQCVDCHMDLTPGLIDHWKGSTHAEKGIGCVECHEANEGDADAFSHYGQLIATVVTPLDCSKCHEEEAKEFAASHHARGGEILASLDNYLAETVEGCGRHYEPVSATPGRADFGKVNGMASVNVGCKQCHGSLVALQTTDGELVTYKDLQPDEDGIPTNKEILSKIAVDKEQSRPMYDASSWPNTGIGRLNLDGSRGSCSACHSRHDFSPRRARQPENCGKCHLGPDHPQKEIFEESKHGIAYRDLKEHMNLDGDTWVLGKDYTQAPTCATCHMSGHTRNDGKITHDPGERISWTNRPPISRVMDTDEKGDAIKETNAELRRELIKDTWQNKRQRMMDVCTHCHTKSYVTKFYEQYDDFIHNYNEKFAKPGQMIMDALAKHKLRTSVKFDDEIEWTWFYLWHHEGRRARHGASMMAPDYAHWHGMYEVAERFYIEFIPQARELCEIGHEEGKAAGAEEVEALIEKILDREEHKWFMSGRKPHGGEGDHSEEPDDDGEEDEAGDSDTTAGSTEGESTEGGESDESDETGDEDDAGESEEDDGESTEDGDETDESEEDETEEDDSDEPASE